DFFHYLFSLAGARLHIEPNNSLPGARLHLVPTKTLAGERLHLVPTRFFSKYFKKTETLYGS
ncbi:MAG: hypothetical protein ABIO44_01715, partial [Saprospiraceae bacterium]